MLYMVQMLCSIIFESQRTINIVEKESQDGMEGNNWALRNKYLSVDPKSATDRLELS